MKINIIISTMYRMVELQEEMVMLLKKELSKDNNLQPSFNNDEEMLTRQQVQKYLNIGETTYKRKVNDGTLKPIKMPGGDRFKKQDLDASFAESVRRGRV